MTDSTIEADCSRRGITRVCHFTQSRNLAHILCDPAGIRCVSEVETHAADVLNPNDTQRLDGKRTHINCSIEYPNTWLLDKVRPREPVFRDWLVVLVKPSVLWRPGTLFTPRNAAASASIAGIEGFRALFAEKIVGARGRLFVRPPAMLSCCPTDGQAEALVERNITLDHIMAIAVATQVQASVEKARLSMLGSASPVRWIVAPAFFDGTWSGLVHRGIRPTESIVG